VIDDDDDDDDDKDDFYAAIAGMNLAGKTEVLGGNLPRRHFIHHKIPHDRPGFEPRTAAVVKLSFLRLRLAEDFLLLTNKLANIKEQSLFRFCSGMFL
jgi:hypothetical protein